MDELRNGRILADTVTCFADPRAMRDAIKDLALRDVEALALSLAAGPQQQ